MTVFKTTDLDEILALPPADRLAIADAILASLEEAPDDKPLPDWQVRVLRERMAADDQDLTPGETWERFRQRVSHR